LAGLAVWRCLNLFSGLFGTTEVVPSPNPDGRGRPRHTCGRGFGGVKLVGSVRRNTTSRGLLDDAKRGEARFVLCVRNEGCPAGLELRKVYRVLADERASRRYLLRVIDESGEDYLYPEEYFVSTRLCRAETR
jgi:hypothetical protein